jgi:hypothetical protein
MTGGQQILQQRPHGLFAPRGAGRHRCTELLQCDCVSPGHPQYDCVFQCLILSGMRLSCGLNA